VPQKGHQIVTHIRPLNVAEKGVAHAAVLRGALNQAGNVRHPDLAHVVVLDDAEVGLDCGERVVGHLGVGPVELEGVRGAALSLIFVPHLDSAARTEDFPALGKPTRPTSAIDLSSKTRCIVSPGRPPCRSFVAAEPPSPPLSNTHISCCSPIPGLAAQTHTAQASQSGRGS
jgi:hypothetical protein